MARDKAGGLMHQFKNLNPEKRALWINTLSIEGLESQYVSVASIYQLEYEDGFN